MYQAKITKEAVNTLPVVSFEGRITLVDELSKVDAAIEELKKSDFVGLDTETKPAFTRGTHHQVSLLQISTLEHCFLFRLNMIGFPTQLANFLADTKTQKIGLSLRDDVVGLNRRHAFKPGGFIDIQAIAKNYGILELSLQKIYAVIFGKKISKAQRLTNWENPELNELQQRYAATDAWASLQIYLELITQKKISKKLLEQLIREHAPQPAAPKATDTPVAQ